MTRSCVFLWRTCLLILCALVVCGVAASDDKPAAGPADEYAAAAAKSPKLSDLFAGAKKLFLPLDLKIEKDEIVASDTDPTLKLRKITAHFWSQQVGDTRWGSQCVVWMPADPAVNATPARKGKVIIFGAPPSEQYDLCVAKYGEPTAARTKYPTMVVDNPGTYTDGRDIEFDFSVVMKMAEKTHEPYYNMDLHCAMIYMKAIDAMEQLLGTKDLHAVIGGHSKRGRAAFFAAALDRRVAGAIEMGHEFVSWQPVPGFITFEYFKDNIKVPIFFIGTTNEDGYAIFNINRIKEHMCPPMTIEMIPNYCHANGSEIQFMDFMMWAAHVFDGRPIARIVDVGHKRQGNSSVFTAKIAGEAKIQTVKTWYVYADEPMWRDLMWYHVLMKKVGDHYEAVLPGKIPDAYLIEVGDIAQGFPGYVSSTPQKLTDAPVQVRRSRGSFPRLWSPQ